MGDTPYLKFLFRLYWAVVALAHANLVFGQEISLDGVARLTWTDGRESVEWSGVAISEDRVLTCEHHNKTGDVRIEFATEGKTRVSVPGRIIKVNDSMDLSLISYEAPGWASVRFYGIDDVKANGEIRGYLRGSAVTRRAPRGREGITFGGRPMVEVLAVTESGMSGSPLLVEGSVCGILLGGANDGVSHCVSPATIREFLKGE